MHTHGQIGGRTDRQILGNYLSIGNLPPHPLDWFRSTALGAKIVCHVERNNIGRGNQWRTWISHLQDWSVAESCKKAEEQLV